MKTKLIITLTALLMLGGISAMAQGSTPKGDINEDGLVNAADVIALINIIINGEKSEQGEIILSNSELSSRLKDKYGNPVLLTSTNTSGTRGYSYTSDGRLAIFGDVDSEFGNSEEHFVVDGLNFKSEYIHDSGSIERFYGNLELNQDGLITNAIVMLTGIRNNGQLKNKYVINYTFFYNAERQLLKIDEEENEEKYDENGNLERARSGHGVQTRTWKNGNLIKVEFTQDDGELDLSSRSGNQAASYSYGQGQNVTKQPLPNQKHLLSDFGINHLYALGLFGVGPANFPSDVTFTLNENGTINTLNNSQYTYAEP